MKKTGPFILLALAFHLGVFLLIHHLIKPTELQDSTVFKNTIHLNMSTEKIGSNESLKNNEMTKSTAKIKGASQKSPIIIKSNQEVNSIEDNQNKVSSQNSNEGFSESILRYEEPIYPRLAQKRGIQGIVKIGLKISKEGEPYEVNLVKSSGHGMLDKAVLDVATKWRFHKKSAEYAVEKNIAFELNEN